MSKSDPDNAIFMADSWKDVERKLKKAYCPEGVVEDNAVLELATKKEVRGQTVPK